MSDRSDIGQDPTQENAVPVIKPNGNGKARKALEDSTALAGNGIASDEVAASNVVSMPTKKEGLTLDRLRQATVKSGEASLKKVTSTPVVINVTKPTKGVPFRAHSDDAFVMDGYTMTVKTPGVIGEVVYLLDPEIAEMIPAHVRFQPFGLCFDAWQRVPFIWPLTVPIEGERNLWTTSAYRIWQAAREDWVCLIPANGAYQLHKPVVRVTGEPVWPGRSIEEVMLLAFRDRYIGPDDRDHKEVQKRLTMLVPDPE